MTYANHTTDLVSVFSTYADDFEAALADDHWKRLERHFAEDIIYHHAEGGRVAGRMDVIRYLQQSVNALDRRFDQRQFIGQPKLTRVGNQVKFNFTVCYQKSGLPDLVLSGIEIATYQGDIIQQMEDTFDEISADRFAKWMAEHAGSLIH